MLQKICPMCNDRTRKQNRTDWTDVTPFPQSFKRARPHGGTFVKHPLICPMCPIAICPILQAIDYIAGKHLLIYCANVSERLSTVGLQINLAFCDLPLYTLFVAYIHAALNRGNTMTTKLLPQSSQLIEGAWYCGLTVQPDGFEQDGLIMQYAGEGQFYDADDWTGRDYGPEMRQYDYLVRQS